MMIILESRKKTLLRHLLPLVAETGWTQDNLKKACQNAHESFTELFSITTKPLDDMITVYSHALDEEMLHINQEETFALLRIRDKIPELMVARLQAMDPFKKAAYKTLIYLSLPQNFLLAQRLKWKTLNDIWYGAGDRATDYNYYTKRLLLSGIYTTTLLYWFNDHTSDFLATRSFLNRRIDTVMNLYKFKARCKQIFPLFHGKKSV